MTHRLRPLTLTLSIAALALVASTPGAGQVPGVDTLRLGPSEAAERAASASPALVRERAEIARARAVRTGAGAFFPELPELEYRQATDAPFANEGEGMWEIGLSQEIEIGGQYFLRRSAADAGVAAAELRVRAAELETRAEARTLHARLAAAEARVRLLDTLAAFTRRLDTVAARLLAAEEISELERNAVRIERGRAEIELIDAVADADEERAALAALVGAGAGVVVVAVADRADSARIASALAEAHSIESALAGGDTTLLALRPDWQALERERERATIERTLAARQALPGVRVGVSLESETRPTETGAAEGSEALETSRMLGFNLGVKIPLPLPGLYDIGQGEVALAEAELFATEAEIRLLQWRIRADVARAAARLRPAAQALAIYERDVAPAVARNLVLLERGYRAGEIGATELVTQGREFAAAAEALIEARLAFDESVAELERALGR